MPNLPPELVMLGESAYWYTIFCLNIFFGSLLNYVPHMLSCTAFLVLYMLLYLTCLTLCVLSCPTCPKAYVLLCLTCLVPYVLFCLKCFVP